LKLNEELVKNIFSPEANTTKKGVFKSLILYQA